MIADSYRVYLTYYLCYGAVRSYMKERKSSKQAKKPRLLKIYTDQSTPIQRHVDVSVDIDMSTFLISCKEMLNSDTSS